MENNKHFDCPLYFMSHVIETRTHEYFPHKEVEKIYNPILEHDKHLSLSKHMD